MIPPLRLLLPGAGQGHGGPADGGPETPRWVKLTLAALAILLVLLIWWTVASLAGP